MAQISHPTFSVGYLMTYLGDGNLLPKFKDGNRSGVTRIIKYCSPLANIPQSNVRVVRTGTKKVRIMILIIFQIRHLIIYIKHIILSIYIIIYLL